MSEDAALTSIIDAIELLRVEDAVKAIRNAVAMGLDLNSRNHNGFYPLSTAMHLANEKYARVFTEMLINAGVDVNRKLHEYPLIKAVCLGDLIIVRLLVNAGANVNVCGFNKRTPLTYIGIANEAVQNAQITDLLIRSGADVNAKSVSLTPVLDFLIHNATYVNADVIKRVLVAGADPNVALPNHGGSLLYRAVKKNLVDVARTLLDFGANVNGSGVPTKKTPLMLAVQKSYLSLMHLLISRGADENIEWIDGVNPPRKAQDLALFDTALYFKQLIDKRKQLRYENFTQRRLAIMMIGHPRLGAESKYFEVDDGILCNLARNDDQEPIYDLPHPPGSTSGGTR